MHTTWITLALLGTLALGSSAQDGPAASPPFPASTALAEGVSPEALDELDQLVQGLVDDGEIVGAELLVIKNGRSILHEAYGWNDREAEAPMETGTVFCVRSMTKPVIGAAILMLIDDDQLELDDRVAQFLPAFGVEGSRDITVEHLLTHTGGLPMSLILGKNLRELDGIGAVAALGGGYPLDFRPGSAFSYSDQGTDTLTALIEVVSGIPAAEFVTTRVLEPIGMHESTCVMTEGHPLRARGCCKYVGSSGQWSRFWRPEDPPLFPFFLGSQGLYSTLSDYALFMDLWRSKGRAGREKLLGARFVRKALTPSPFPLPAPTGLPGLTCDYGYLMQLWTGPGEDGEDEVVAFGHTGSDGTHAWVFPEQKAMVLYFTQSRGNATGLRVEEALGELFLGVPFDPSQAAPPLEPYLGYYREHADDLYRAIVRDGDGLALEILGKAVVPLTYVGADSWKLRPDPSKTLVFDRSDTGDVTGYHIGTHVEYRFVPSADLPHADEVTERVARTHRLDLLESLGPIRMKGELSMEKLGITGELFTWLAWPDRFRVDSHAAGEYERAAFDGEHMRYASRSKPRATIEGQAGDLLRLDNPLARFGDWRGWHARLQVVQRLERGGREIILVRAGDASAPASTMYVDWESGRVVHEDGMTHIETLGRIGQRVDFGDFRDVSGMLLPFRTEIELANPLIGTIATKVIEIDLGVELSEGTFELDE